MQLKFNFPIDRADSFETFVTDEKNEQQIMLCRAFASRQTGQPKSLTLYGSPAVGKTHLLGAIGRAIKTVSEENSALYLDSALLREKVEEVRAYEELKSYLAKYEKASCLAVDNLEVIENDHKAQEQVFHLYNAVIQKGGVVAVALRKAPPDWSFVNELSTRLLWGQALEINPVGNEKRAMVLVKMAADIGMTLPENCANWLLAMTARDSENQRMAINKIDRYSLTTGRKVSIQLIKEALASE